MRHDGIVAFVNKSFLEVNRSSMNAAAYAAAVTRSRAVEVDIRARVRAGESLDDLVICIWPDNGVSVWRKDLDVQDAKAPRHYIATGKAA